MPLLRLPDRAAERGVEAVSKLRQFEVRLTKYCDVKVYAESQDAVADMVEAGEVDGDWYDGDTDIEELVEEKE